MKKSLLAILSVVTAAAIAGCGSQETASSVQTEKGAEAKPLVYTTVYPLEYVAKRIGGDHVDVVNIIPPGVEPHDFEPTAKDMVAMSKADIFAYNGSGLELWVDKAAASFDKNKTTVVNTSEGLDLLKATADEHDHGQFDPHVWLDPTLLKAEADKIKAALVQKDKAHEADYVKNYQALATDLDQLDKEFKDMVAQAPKKEFMTTHAAFGYMAHRYGLEQLAISGLDPSEEPSPAKVKELVDHVKEHKISYVMFETLVSPKLAEVIAKESGAKTAVLNPLEGLTEDDVKAGRDYLSIMRQNIETLRLALK